MQISREISPDSFLRALLYLASLDLNFADAPSQTAWGSRAGADDDDGYRMIEIHKPAQTTHSLTLGIPNDALRNACTTERRTSIVMLLKKKLTH